MSKQSISTWQKLWAWFLTLAGPRHFVYTFSPWVKVLTPIAVLLFMIGAVWGVLFTPSDYLQGHSYRIMYIHVPAAALSLSIYFGMAILSVIALVWRLKAAEEMVGALAEIGLVLCALALVTGSVWGKPTWGTYWVWDARLTSTLIQLFFYVGVVAIFHSLQSGQQSRSAALYLSIVGAINVIIVKYSVTWWNSLHQDPSISVFKASSSIDSSMLWPLLVMFLACYLMVMAMALHLTITRLMRRHIQHGWVADFINRK